MASSLPLATDPDPDRKRRREEIGSGSVADDTPPPKRSAAAAAGDVVLRVVVPPNRIGGVIGKGGARIQQIRAETGAGIKIVDAANRNEERVIIISSGYHDNEISSAESALYSIAKVILKESEDSIGTLNTVAAAAHTVAHTIRLLIAGCQAGCLIGISGQNIVHIRNASGATVNILAQNQLPICASVYESDRVVQVSGNVPEVLKALEIIGHKLRENPPKNPFPVRPRHNYSSTIPYPSSHLPPSSGELFHQADHVTSEMMIAEKLVGGLIGRNGYNISKIRIESGAAIKVSGTKGEGDQRLINFEGSTHQVISARMMVENYILTQLLPQYPS
ncbi:RNA-binding KH domain-containing protein isoform X1 [Iris pallida]|uniref:RNA-binding KH domain-containing protein isoform X1 n=1 Tax=Iris pallida TaxID=29817 RepID=A0AAX6IE96_IRIPA|nr:RNA-binding KH domain-containing protein isoform X1 [Iris pallida]KAJ6851566.1 RNA-binding KH domain-containing protein isoform X1 [Iris pallida]